jgi:hypothetical protein
MSSFLNYMAADVVLPRWMLAIIVWPAITGTFWTVRTLWRATWVGRNRYGR